MERKIIVLSGPSGVGKTTLYKRLLREFSSSLDFSISATTRPIRPGEKNGLDYYFIKEEEFIKKINLGEFVEWAKVHGHYYGTLKSEVERILANGKNCLLDVDVQGGLSIKKTMPGSILIFIFPPSFEELEKRIKERKSDTQEEIKIRLEQARKELELSKEYHYSIVNDELERAYAELKNLVMEIVRN